MSSHHDDKTADASFDNRPTLTHSEARNVYDAFANANHKQGGKDASSGYGGPAVTALLEMANFNDATCVLDYGCGQGKFAGLVFAKTTDTLHWWGMDTSPNMVNKFQQQVVNKFGAERCRVDLLPSGDPAQVVIPSERKVDRFVSTYCLDLLSEQDMYRVLDLAQSCLHADKGILLLAGITWGYRDSIQTFIMTFIWELLYLVYKKKVGGCRPQTLRPYLEARGWQIVKEVRTLPNGYPWMVSEVLSARPPSSKNKIA